MPRQRPPRAPATGELGLFDVEPPAEPRPRKARSKRAQAAPPSAPVVAEPTPYDDVGENFPGASPRSAIGVSTLTQSVKDVLEGAFFPLWVRGEITDFKAHRNGAWYFCLRDGTSQVRCVFWSRDRRRVPAPPDDGMQVLVLGQLTLYPARGDMQFVVRRIAAEGDGLLRKALELTQAKLAAEGLLAPERKRPLPRHPRVIAVITSPDGAALHDISAVIARRAPRVRLVLIPAAVQGERAPDDLCFALDQLERWGGADTLIFGRGGGAREDLWAFNDERVARALAACSIPTISAVGHEIDVTICDLIADFRAPTPSAAAEAATRSTEEIAAELRGYASAMTALLEMRARRAGDRLRRATRSFASVAALAVERRRGALRLSAGKLQALSPLATLARGYAVARSTDGTALTTAAEFREGAEFELLVRDGAVGARVIGPRPWPAMLAKEGDDR